jgi:hypothetical protein
MNAAVLATCLFAASPSFAQGNTTNGSGQFSMQGELTNTSGTAIADGLHMLNVNLYPVGSSQAVYTEVDTVTTKSGIFSTMVGANGQSSLHINGNTLYQLGLSVDGQSELTPRIPIGQVPQAISAESALVANGIAGFSVDSTGVALPHSLLALNSLGQIASGVMDSSVVTTVNGVHGPINIMGGGNMSVTTTQGPFGTTLNLGFTGSGSGLALPFAQAVNLPTGNALSITNTLAGNAASLANTGVGNALDATATTGSAISAISTGALTDAATISAQNSLGMALSATTATGSAIVANATSTGNAIAATATSGNAINATTSTGSAIVANATSTGNALVANATSTGNALVATATSGMAVNATTSTGSAIAANATSTGSAITATATSGAALNATASGATNAVLQVTGTGSATASTLISATNSASSNVFNVAANGATQIQSSATTALTAATTAVGGTAAKLTGGLSLVGPTGIGSIASGSATATIMNAYAKATSIVFVTLSSAAGISVPLTVTSVASGSFTVAPVGGLNLSNTLSFSYLIVNPQ